MAENLKALSNIPVFGFEWSGCHALYNSDNQYKILNGCKAAGCIPIINLIAGALLVWVGVQLLSGGNTKGAAVIARGIVTILGGGIPLALVDLAVTVGRIALRDPKSVETDSDPDV